MLGEFLIDDGDYLFTLKNVINKRFVVEKGGSITWSGDPNDANVNLKAIYRTKASLHDLIVDASEDYRRKIPVECQIFMTEKLMNPSIRFNIELPSSPQESTSILQSAISTEEEMSKQFLSLLVLNSFLPNPALANVQGNPLSGNSGISGVGVTTSELLSNQLSNWLSQISNDVDIGVNYRLGDELTRDELEVALSTQLLNDRLTINGNVDVGGNQSASNTSKFVGDFEMDYKIRPSGKLRLKAFNRSNDNYILKQVSPYTQGFGLFYREDFDSFDELARNYWNRIFAKKEDKPEALSPEAETEE
jgi:hypothetical protein